MFCFNFRFKKHANNIKVLIVDLSILKQVKIFVPLIFLYKIKKYKKLFYKHTVFILKF